MDLIRSRVILKSWQNRGIFTWTSIQVLCLEASSGNNADAEETGCRLIAQGHQQLAKLALAQIIVQAHTAVIKNTLYRLNSFMYVIKYKEQMSSS